jgi:hypothetical protein
MDMISLKYGMFDEIGPVDSIGVTIRLKEESMPGP